MTSVSTLLRMSDIRNTIFINIIFNFLKLNQFHIIENKFTNYYINIYTCYNVVIASNGLRIK